jgi:hypothetical protein
MQYPPEVLLRLFDDAAKKANLSYEHSDSETLALEINEQDPSHDIQFKGRYLYDTYRAIKIAIGQQLSSVEFSPPHINRIAQYIGLRDYHAYKKSIKEEKKGESSKSENNEIPQNDNKSIGPKNVTNIGRDFNGTLNNH